MAYKTPKQWFKEYAEKHGLHAAVKWRDSGKAIPRGKAAP